MRKWNPILLVTSCSLILVSILGTYLFIQYQKIEWIRSWNEDPSANVRNIVLGIIAFSGVPFLVYGHLLRRSDLLEKRRDQKLRSETVILQEIIKSIDSVVVQMDKDAIKIKPRQMAKRRDIQEHILKELDDLQNKSRTKLDQIRWMDSRSNHAYIADVHDMINLVGNSETDPFWSGHKKETLRVCNSLKLSHRFVNKDLENLVSSRFASSFNLLHLKTFVLTASSIDFLNYGYVRHESILTNFQTLNAEFLNMRKLSLISPSEYAELLQVNDKMRYLIDGRDDKAG